MSYVFHDACVVSCEGDVSYGPFFTISFAQPHHLVKEPVKKRREYWCRKKLLMQDSLVLLVRDPGKASMVLVPLIVAKREDVQLAKDDATIGLSCAFNQGPCADDLKVLSSWMSPRGTNKKRQQPRLLLIETKSNYVSCAPILRALQKIDQGDPLPLMEQLLRPSSQQPQGGDGQRAFGNGPPPAYIQQTR